MAKHFNMYLHFVIYSVEKIIPTWWLQVLMLSGDGMNLDKLGKWGFTPEDFDFAQQILDKWGDRAYYKMGALMAVITQEKMKEYGYKYGGDVPFTGWTEYLAKLTPGGWNDHMVKITHPKEKGGGYHVVSSPYGLEQEDMEQLISFCKKYGYAFRIPGIPKGAVGQFYFPGHAIDIHIYQKEANIED